MKKLLLLLLLPVTALAVDKIIIYQEDQSSAPTSISPSDLTVGYASDLTCTNCIGSTEIDGSTLEAEMEAVLDLSDLQGTVTEDDPQVTTLTSGNFCKGTGSAVACTDSSTYLTAETDPQVGTLTNTKWCTTDGTDIDCTTDAPAGSGDVTDVFNCAAGDCASIVAGATDLLNFSGNDASTATEGLILPQHATACAGGTAEGQVCWEADADKLYVGNGTVIVEASYMPRGHIWGLTMSNAADAANDITVAAGEARSELGTVDMTLAAPITKRMDAGWVVGDAQGGLNTGAEAADTWYEVHLIKRVDTGVVDVMFTTTANRATLPTGYTQQRRIGWVRNDAAGALLAFTQIDDHFTLTTQVNSASFTATTSAAPIAVMAPPSSIARLRIGTTSSTAVNTTNATIFSEIVEGDVTPTETTGIVSIGANDIAGADGGHIDLRVSSTSTIEHDSDGTTYTVDVSTFGWIDMRGRLSSAN